MENKNSTKHPSAYKIISIVVIAVSYTHLAYGACGDKIWK